MNKNYLNFNPDNINPIKDALERWSQTFYGPLAPNFKEKVSIKKVEGFKILKLSLDTLTETRRKEERKNASKKSTLPDHATISFSSVDAWTFPTPPHFKTSFEETVAPLVVPGSEFYEKCSPCAETGALGCKKCQEVGSFLCDICEGDKQIDCPTCDGFGELNCRNCGGSGAYEQDCPACHRGMINCDACSGRGHHYGKDSNKYDCRQCDGTGNKTCTRCGGAATETKKCTKCSNGNIPCQTCRTQKKVKCTKCNPEGRILCPTCSGNKSVTCKDCEGIGGFKKFVTVFRQTQIESNEIKLSAIKDLPKLFKPEFKENLNIHQPTFTLQELVNLAKEPNFNTHLQELTNHVQQVRSTTHLLERFSILEAQLVKFDFEYEGSIGQALFDVNSGKLHLEKDPLKDHHSDLKDRILKDFENNLKDSNYSACEDLVTKTKKYFFPDLEKDFRKRIDTQKIEQDKAARAKYTSFVHIGLPLVAVSLIWLALGFVIPMSLTLLGVLITLAYNVCSKQSDFTNPPKYEEINEAKKNYLKLSVLIVLLLVLNFFYVSSFQKDKADRRLKQGEVIFRK